MVVVVVVVEVALVWSVVAARWERSAGVVRGRVVVAKLEWRCEVGDAEAVGGVVVVVWSWRGVARGGGSRPCGNGVGDGGGGGCGRKRSLGMVFIWRWGRAKEVVRAWCVVVEERWWW